MTLKQVFNVFTGMALLSLPYITHTLFIDTEVNKSIYNADSRITCSKEHVPAARKVRKSPPSSSRLSFSCSHHRRRRQLQLSSSFSFEVSCHLSWIPQRKALCNWRFFSPRQMNFSVEKCETTVQIYMKRTSSQSVAWKYKRTGGSFVS